MEPAEQEPKVEPSDMGVSSPKGGLDPVGIAQPAKQDAGGEDQGQDEYEDEYEDDFVGESAALGQTQGSKTDFEATFEESGFEEDESGEATAEDGA